MNKPLAERIENEIKLSKNQQKFLSHMVAVAGLIGLCFVVFGAYINGLEETQMQRIINPQLDWTIIGSLISFILYCIIGLIKFRVYHHTWKLKKELLSLKRNYAYRYVHPVNNTVGIVINYNVLKSLEAKKF